MISLTNILVIFVVLECWIIEFARRFYVLKLIFFG